MPLLPLTLTHSLQHLPLADAAAAVAPAFAEHRSLGLRGAAEQTTVAALSHVVREGERLRDARHYHVIAIR